MRDEQSVQYLFYLIQNFKPLAIFSDCVARFVSDLVGNPEDRFPHNEAHFDEDPTTIDVFIDRTMSFFH